MPTKAPALSPSPAPSATRADFVVSTELTLSGLACADYGTDEETALIAGVSATVAGVNASDITSKGCTDARRRLDTRRRLTSSATIALDITISAARAGALGSSTASDLATSIGDTLKAAASSGDLETNIKSAAEESSVLASVTVSEVTTFVATSTPTLSPTSTPASGGGGKNKDDDNSEELGLGLGLGLGLPFCLLAAGAFAYWLHHLQQGNEPGPKSAPRPTAASPSESAELVVNPGAVELGDGLLGYMNDPAEEPNNAVTAHMVETNRWIEA